MLDPNIKDLHQMAAETGSEDALEALLDEARGRMTIHHNECCRVRYMHGETGHYVRDYAMADQRRKDAGDEVDNLLRLLGRIQ